MNIAVRAGSGSDNTFGRKIRDTIKAGDLILRDLGYFNFEDFLDIGAVTAKRKFTTLRHILSK